MKTGGLGGINAQIYKIGEGNILGEEGKKRILAKISQVIKLLNKLKEVMLLHQIIKTLFTCLKTQFLFNCNWIV